MIPSFPPEVRLIISDVDETIADNYKPACPRMIQLLEKLLLDGMSLVLVSGQSAPNIHERVVKHITLGVRKKILIGHCNGSEVWGYGEDGQLLSTPHFSRSSELIPATDQARMRDICAQAVESFRLCLFPTMPFQDFRDATQADPRSVMYDDRGAQLTYEFPFACTRGTDNDSGLQGIMATSDDLRTEFIDYLNFKFERAGIPVSAQKAGSFAVDIVASDVTKKTAVQFIMHSDVALAHLGLCRERIASSRTIEVWGDRFSCFRNGADRHILEALDPQVRAIDFRPEPLHELPIGRNIVTWNGQSHLHEGLLEYLSNSGLGIPLREATATSGERP